ncbi:MAG: sulfotransferase [Pseudomonadota bacterium]
MSGTEQKAQAASIFVYGALRSGTTMFRLMLRAHPAFINPGEADYLFDHIARGPDGRWSYDLDALTLSRVFRDAGLAVPDGTPERDNDGPALLAEFLRQLQDGSAARLVLAVHRHVDKIAALLPEAPILHLLRDPRDVARSCIGMGWAGLPYFGVDGWIETERAWDRVSRDLREDRALDLRYEELIRAPQDELGRVCAFLGVPFDAAMLGYDEGSTYGAPDPSLVEQWRRKMAPQDLALVEGKLGATLVERGYQPSGVPQRTPTGLERAWMRLRDKLAVWRFLARRYGTGRVILEKASRRMGWKVLHRRVVGEIQAISRQHLR